MTDNQIDKLFYETAEKLFINDDDGREHFKRYIIRNETIKSKKSGLNNKETLEKVNEVLAHYHFYELTFQSTVNNYFYAKKGEKQYDILG